MSESSIYDILKKTSGFRTKRSKSKTYIRLVKFYSHLITPLIFLQSFIWSLSFDFFEKKHKKYIVQTKQYSSHTELEDYLESKKKIIDIEEKKCQLFLFYESTLLGNMDKKKSVNEFKNLISFFLLFYTRTNIRTQKKEFFDAYFKGILSISIILYGVIVTVLIATVYNYASCHSHLSKVLAIIPLIGWYVISYIYSTSLNVDTNIKKLQHLAKSDKLIKDYLLYTNIYLIDEKDIRLINIRTYLSRLSSISEDLSSSVVNSIVSTVFLVIFASGIFAL